MRAIFIFPIRIPISAIWLGTSAVEDQQYKNNYFYDGCPLELTTVQITTGEVAAIYMQRQEKGTGVLERSMLLHFCNNPPYAIQIYTGVTDSQNPESENSLRPAL